jgi:poly(3-hydroxyalkanoate) synthetase
MNRAELPSPLSRRGPRPLLLHLSLAWMRSNASIAASPSWSSVWQHLSETGTEPKLEAEVLAATFITAAEQDAALVSGIAAYRAFPYRRDMPDPPAIWEEGETRLLDFGGEGPVVLFVPSLINRAYILDLMEGASMLRFMAQHGTHPLLLDWGWPGEAERKFTLTDYIAGRLERALAAIPGPVVLAGYCMGGLLALTAALRAPEKVTALALLATPWDFQAEDPAQARKLAESAALFEPAMRFSGTLPIDVLQTLFTMIDPFGVGEKYRDFASQNKALPRAKRFVAMEDWLADGVPLAAPVAREALSGWYGANEAARGEWRVAGLPVVPEQLAVPVFAAIPGRDKLVPASSALPLARRAQNAKIIEPAAGHIGMIAGTNARSALWEPFIHWLRSL